MHAVAHAIGTVVRAQTTCDELGLVNPIDSPVAQALAAYEPQQLQRGDRCQAAGSTRQGAHVHAAGMVGDHRHHQLVVMALELHVDALIGPHRGFGRCRAGGDTTRVSR